jgi:hypothetical protein
VTEARDFERRYDSGQVSCELLFIFYWLNRTEVKVHRR